MSRKSLNKFNSIFKKNSRPFIVAELSGNHNKSLNRALKIVEKAAEAGADAIKIQTYKADTITMNIKNKNFFIKDKKNLWKGNYLFDLYSKASTPWSWIESIYKKAKEKNILCFSSVFDLTSVDFLEKLGNPIYKISSFEIVDIPLIKRVAKTGKPVIISTGMAKLSEIKEAVNTLKLFKCKKFILLKCTSSYPASPKDSNINTIPKLQKLFSCPVGISDHTLGRGVSIASISMGAKVIEKHITLNKDDGAVDSKFSLEPNEFKMLVEDSKVAFESLGKIKFGPSKNEKNNFKSRKSIYVSKDIKAGERINKDNILVIRPGYGLHPRYYDKILNKKVKLNIKKGTPTSWKIF